MENNNDNSNLFKKYILPSKQSDLEIFSRQFKIEMMEHVLDSIEIGVNQELPLVEVFQFKNSDFVITLGEKDYVGNLDNIFDYFIKNELYENCGRITTLQKTLKEKFGNTINEKEKS